MSEPTTSSAAPRPSVAQDDLMDRLNRCESLTRGPLYSLTVEAAIEIERLRMLIIEWADASDNDQNEATNASAVRYVLAADALRQAVGR